MAKKVKLILAAVFAAVIFETFQLISSEIVHADSSEQGAINLQVSPTKQKLSLTPGSSYVGTFKVRNAGTLPFSYSVTATPYSVTNDKYSPDYTGLTYYTQIADWITFDKATESGMLEPGQIVEVAYTVNVPKEAPAGGQYAALMAQTSDGNGENATVAVVHRVGMILYAAVPGETHEGPKYGEIIKNNINTFYFTPPITVSSLVHNSGNVEQTATYTVKIYPLFSNEAVFSNEEKPDKEKQLDVIPDTSRFNSISWEGAPQIGIFSVEQTIEFAGQISTNKKLVLICPLWLLFIIFALLFFTIFWLFSRAKNRKREAARRSRESEKSLEKEKEE